MQPIPANPWLAAYHRLALSQCIPEIHQQIVDDKLPHEILLNEKIGEIKTHNEKLHNHGTSTVRVGKIPEFQ
jgi:hypothetical protein